MTNRTFHPAGLALAMALIAVAASTTSASAGPGIIRFRLSTTGLDSDARAGIEYDATPGAERFRLKVLDVPAGRYVLLLNGSSAGTIGVTGPAGSTHGLMSLATADGSLGFSPFGAQFGISDGSGLFLTGAFPANVASALQNQLISIDLQGVGAPANASGRVEMRDKNGRRTLKIVLGKMPKVSCEFQLDGVLMGFVDVNGQGSGTLRFSTQPNDAGFDGDDYLPLTFDPSGKTITITSAGQVLMSGTFPGLSDGCGLGGCTFDPAGNGSGAVR